MLRHLEGATAPVAIADFVDLLGFNQNAVRQHLAVLVEAGLVAETTEARATRGRPRKLYELRTDALSAFREVAGGYEYLSRLLLQVIDGKSSPYEVGFEEGRASAEGSDDAAIVRQLAAGGFEPVVGDDGAIRLDHCPFADAATSSPGVVCEIHRGLIDGQLEGGRPSTRIELLPRPPKDAGCIVRVLNTD